MMTSQDFNDCVFNVTQSLRLIKFRKFIYSTRNSNKLVKKYLTWEGGNCIENQSKKLFLNEQNYSYYQNWLGSLCGLAFT